MNGKRKSQRKTPWVNGPKPRQREILDRAFAHIKSVPYKVSLRWVFYRLLQEGLYKTKEDYKNLWAFICGKARHAHYKEWRPDTLVDETREIVKRTYGMESVEEAIESIPDSIRALKNIYLDHFYQQECYVEIWFEARAMNEQFKHYTREIDLVPMAGQPSISLKSEIAKELEHKSNKYGLPMTVLYFGDEDLAGHEIYNGVLEDVSEWCDADFNPVWCGLTEAQAKKYGVPESYEKKGYQWEALGDEAAGEIITESVNRHVSKDVRDAVERQSDEAGDKLYDILEKTADEVESLLEE